MILNLAVQTQYQHMTNRHTQQWLILC